MRRRSKFALAVAGIGVAAAVASTPAVRSWFVAMAAPTETAAVAPPPLVVMVTTARLDTAAPVHRLAGTIRARTETDLGFRLGGKLLARPAEVGDRVAAGDVVATLDDTDLRLQLEAAEAARSSAKIALEKGEVDLTRVTTLEKKGWVSDQASDARTVDVEALRAQLLQAERSVELAQNALSYATLRADAAGVVTETYAEAGQVLELGQPVVRIARTGEREAVVSVPEALVGAIAGAAAEAELWSEPGHPFPVVLRELVARRRRRDPHLRGALHPPGRHPGRARHERHRHDHPGRRRGRRPAADLGADRHRLRASVWVIGADDRLEARPVAVAGYTAGQARIASGLAGGERVVVLGAHRLQAGAPVRALAAEG